MPVPDYFSAIVWCVMENKAVTHVKDLPSHKYLAQHGAVLDKAYALTHPSGPNYRNITSGQVFTQNYLHMKAEPNVARSYETIGIPSFNWYPKGKAALKHDPYKQVHPQITTWSKPFDPDLLPRHCQVYLGYDLISNGHDGPIKVASQNIDKTVMGIIEALNNSAWFNTPDEHGRYPVFMLTYDESFTNDNRIFTAFYGRGVKAGYTSPKRYDHLNICRTMTDNWQLPPLGNAAKVKPIDDIWLPAAKPKAPAPKEPALTH